ncbi:S-methyl-5-thioribose kinase [Anaerocolumna aminovalerica]|uniref:S-methyl-5-thioribose kinase n=1 Tax=Anaerocolumna aminovalerica TaxID=1527 RepID=A0A1I5J190_9FIRM|nr:S-methyl-5-thioribose kinase [Anaerocolumna aminovalerica]MBU5331994.1 S-methyl-5-thioribose kinase [Anaerocolumna aminovalerica]MDU6266519.1 S-methyl-5-thioribose kinase [Anaerocolumna aminovalerica]SFO66585.1 5'-methylthioribose kinase [Anaerocolumna aminovalerica]
MSRFDSYFLMKANDVPEYVREKLSFFPKDAKLECKEIGDGNLNYVFRVEDIDTKKTLIVKQAGEVTRISADMKLSTDRGRIEAKILGIQNKYAPGLVPEVYLYDEVMCAMIMEDMIGHTMMRTGLLKHEKYPNFAEDITTFMVNSLLLTTDVVMGHKEKKENVKSFINPDLCEISEDLVYSEPFIDYNKRNNVFPPNADFVKRELYEDNALHLEAAKLKFEFMNNAQSLIHGDLHTGSIFINQNHTYVFDPEFAFYGPMGYDVGNVIANMFFAWCHGDATIEDEAEKADFCGWVLDTIEEIVDKFIAKFKVAFKENVTDTMAKTEGFLEWYLGTVLADTAGIAGLESIRRTVGMANVKDITTIPDEKKRARAERIVITLAKDYIMNRTSFKCGADYRKAIETAVAKIN